MGRLADSKRTVVLEPEKPVEQPPPVVEVPEVKAPEPQPVQPQEVKKEAPKKPIRVKDVGGRRWWLVWTGVGGIGIGIGGFILFMGNGNMVIGMFSIALIIGGGIGIYYGLQNREAGIVVVNPDKKNQQVKANSLNIYDGRVAFEELPEDKLLGIPRKCLNDGKFYHLHIQDSAWGNKSPKGGLIEFKLPDTQYRDPREFSLNIEIPAHRRLSQRKATLMEKISPWILIVAIVIIGIIWVATTPAKGG